MKEEQAPNGAYEWVPEGAVVVYPRDVAQKLFGHAHPGSTRKAMSRHEVETIEGWWVDEVHWVLENRDPRFSGYPRTRGAGKKPSRNK